MKSDEKKLEQYTNEFDNAIVLLIIDDLVRGLNNREIKYKYFDKPYNLRLNTDKYLKKAYSILQDGSDEYLDNLRTIQSNRIENIMKSCLENNDRKTALQAIETLNKLQGLYIDKKEVTANGDFHFNFGKLEDIVNSVDYDGTEIE